MPAGTNDCSLDYNFPTSQEKIESRAFPVSQLCEGGIVYSFVT